VRNEPEAEIVCSRLRAAGIESAYRVTDISAEAFGGWQEILVRRTDLERARKLLARTRV
jgi:Putative prokaryotic signal transducing protein